MKMKLYRIIIPALVILAGPFTLHAGSAKDEFFAIDKLKHFAVAAALTGYSASAYRHYAGGSDRDALVFSVTLTVSLSFAKEFWDKSRNENISLYDLAADFAGIGAGYALFGKRW